MLSKCDNKHEGVVITVMQRIYKEDLTGLLIETDVNKEWVYKNGIYRRQEGEALHIARKYINHLNHLKQTWQLCFCRTISAKTGSD